jgi:alpha-tubulin suppressor-like RCC1 family protein
MNKITWSVLFVFFFLLVVAPSETIAQKSVKVRPVQIERPLYRRIVDWFRRVDNCPDDPAKRDPGICGCGVSDVDSDADGTPDCIDNCPSDPNKTEPGICGCAVPDVDSDQDGVLDCNDNCPANANPDQADMDGDNLGDVCDDDMDGDDLANTQDNCPGVANQDQADQDGNCVGDVCDSPPLNLPVLSNVKKVASSSHACAIKNDGTLWCWGRNEHGALGDGSDVDDAVPDDSVRPRQVRSPDGQGFVANVKDVAVGEYHTCFVTQDGSAYCMGVNTFGELGNPNVTGSPTSIDADTSIPVQVVHSDGAPLSGVISVVAGQRNACALKSDGTVWCWGYLDDYTINKIPHAVQVKAGDMNTDLTDVVHITAEFYSACALKSDHSIWCWGRDLALNWTQRQPYAQQLPIPFLPDQPSFVPVQISGGTHAICVVSQNANAYCLGSGLMRGDGSNPTDQSPGFHQVQGTGGDGVLGGVQQISVGYEHVCAIILENNQRTAMCWGDDVTFSDRPGVLGRGECRPEELVVPYPIRVKGPYGEGHLVNVRLISSNVMSTCAIIGNEVSNEVYCWGANHSGQLGFGELRPWELYRFAFSYTVPVPVQVSP